MRPSEVAAAQCAADAWWGAGSVGPVFDGHMKVLAPWPGASRSKHGRLYDPEVVGATLQGPQWVQPVDSRILRATQPWVTRAGVSHYLTGSYERTGITFADRHSAANRLPIVWVDVSGQRIVLTGHHRSAAALVRGRPVWVRLLPRAGTPSYRSVTAGLHVNSGVVGATACSAEEAAVLLGRFEPAAVTSDEEALEALTGAGTDPTVAAAAIRHSLRGSRP